MILDKISVGPLRVNNYLIVCEETKEAALFDAGGNIEATKQLVSKHDANLKYILNTHGHFDHICGVDEVKKEYDCKMLIHKADEEMVKNLKQTLVVFGMPDYEVPEVDEFVEENQIINIGNIKIQVIHTPGHSKGCVCYLVNEQNVLISGDTLFARSVGRTDLPGASYKEIKNSIMNKLFELKDEVNVYPGHGKSTTIGEEKIENPLFGQNVTEVY